MAITFGAKVIRLARHNDGTVQHARLVIDDSIIMLNEASENYPTNSSQMQIFVNSVQGTYEIAIQKMLKLDAAYDTTTWRFNGGVQRPVWQYLVDCRVESSNVK